MLDRKQAPVAYMLDDLALTKPQVTKLKNGLELHCLTDDTNPVIKLDCVFPYGKFHEEVPGQATICAKLLTEGTKSYNSEDFQNTLDHYGAHFDVSADYDHTTLTLLCLKEHVRVLLPLFKSVITEPLFDFGDFEKIKIQRIQKIRVNAQKNALIATKLLRNKLLKGSPYSIVLEEEHLKAIQINDVVSYFNKQIKTKPNLIIAGDVSEKVVDLLDDTFGTLTFKSESPNYIVELTSDFKEEVHQKSGSVQASLRIGTISIAKTHDDYFDLSISNEILGGYFGSRLMRNIREDKGYTYGIYSTIINYKYLDYHIIGADVKLEFVDDAVEEIFKEMKIMQTDLVSNEELETVKNYMLGKLAGHLDTIFSQADNYKSKLFEGLDFQQYFDDYVSAIKKISSERILEISQKYFSKDYCIVKVI
jgi:predicted Zn-dependent peptidase